MPDCLCLDWGEQAEKDDIPKDQEISQVLNHYKCCENCLCSACKECHGQWGFLGCRLATDFYSPRICRCQPDSSELASQSLLQINSIIITVAKGLRLGLSKAWRSLALILIVRFPRSSLWLKKTTTWQCWWRFAKLVLTFHLWDAKVASYNECSHLMKFLLLTLTFKLQKIKVWK